MKKSELKRLITEILKEDSAINSWNPKRDEMQIGI